MVHFHWFFESAEFLFHVFDLLGPFFWYSGLDLQLLPILLKLLNLIWLLFSISLEFGSLNIELLYIKCQILIFKFELI